MVIAYHASGYPFNCSDGNQRWSYYGISGTPIVRCDGDIQIIGGIASTGTMYATYRRNMTQELPVSSPLLIDVSCSYNSGTNNGTVTALVTNTTGAAVSGNIYFAVTENKIPYTWYSLTTVEHVCRDMLPNGLGTAVSVPASDTIIRSQAFTISGSWNEDNIYIVVWVQNTSTDEIYQAGLVNIMNQPDMEYWGLTLTELNGNFNRIAEPGEDVRLYVKAKNNGGGSYTTGTTITTSDPYVTVNSSTPQVTAIGQGEIDTVLTANCTISNSCPNDHIAEFLLTFAAAGDTSRLRLMVTNRSGIENDVESGTGSWTTSGSGVWHITAYRSHSPTHSWTNNNESNHLYPNFQNSFLYSPYFVVTPDSAMRFWHRYNFQNLYDYAFFEVDNNCGWWRTLGTYTSAMATFTEASFPFAEYSGQTVRLRFRTVSNSSTQQEGWYVDDVENPITFGIEEETGSSPAVSLTAVPSVFSQVLRIETNGPGRCRIYDASGRTIREWNTVKPGRAELVWQGADETGKTVSAGIYFIQLETNGEKLLRKVLFVR